MFLDTNVLIYAEQAAPDEVMRVLRESHAAVGALIHQHEGRLERFLGDGPMVLFNDPVPCDADPGTRGPPGTRHP